MDLAACPTDAFQPATAACDVYRCTGTGASCPGSCSLSSECQPPGRCVDLRCAPPGEAGSACTRAAQCSSDFCADGVCCDTGCDGACDACNLAGTVGTCSLNPAGFVGAPDCAPYLCSGTSAQCPAGCGADAACLAPSVCVLGQCTLQCVSGACNPESDAGAVDAGRPDAGTGSGAGSGCGCGATSPGAPFVLLVLLGLAVRRRAPVGR